MCILYKVYFVRLRLLRSSDVEENSRPRSACSSCRVVFTKKVYTNIRGLHENLSDLSLIVSEMEMWFSVLRLLTLSGAKSPSSWFRVLDR